MRAAAGSAVRFNVLRIAAAWLTTNLQRTLKATNLAASLREIEFRHNESGWIFAQSVFPRETTCRHPWLLDLGHETLGEALGEVGQVLREPFEYLELRAGGLLPSLLLSSEASLLEADSAWARRSVYQIVGDPILVTEVFLRSIVEHVD
jgi:chorismate--pyruvate lyase